MTAQSLDDLSVRVTLLERRSRVWRNVAIAFAATAAAGGIMAFRSAASPTLDGERLVLHAPGGGARAIELSVTPQGALQAQFLGDTVALRVMSRNDELILRDQAGREVAHLGGPMVRHVAP